MAVHIIPETEIELHEESQDCLCEPAFMMDEETGEMVWAHNMLDGERLLDDFVTYKYGRKNNNTIGRRVPGKNKTKPTGLVRWLRVLRSVFYY